MSASKRFHIFCLGIISMMTLAGWLLFSKDIGLACLAGSALMYVNVLALKYAMGMIFKSEESASQVKGGVLLFVKLLALFGLAYVFLTVLNLDSTAFALAASAMILTIAMFSAKELTSLE